MTAPGPDRPRNTSAPASTSSAVPRTPRGLVRAASAARVGVEALASPAYIAPLAVADDHVADALGEHDLGAGDAGRAGADDDHGDVLGALADEPQRVQQRGEHDDRGAVLVVVEDRDVELGAQPPLDLEAARRRDVLEVDAAERRRRRLHERDDLVDVLGVEAERERVDAGELLEQQRLALHHRHRRLRADVAEAEHGRAVGDDGDGVALDRQRPAPSRGPRGSPCDTRPTPGV